MTLEEICGYFPFNLRAKLSQIGKLNLDSEYPNEHENKIGTIASWNICGDEIGGVLEVTNKYSFEFCEINEIDILMRPLSDLTIEIEHNGEKFVPIVELCKIGSPYKIYEIHHTEIIEDTHVLHYRSKGGDPYVFGYDKDGFYHKLWTPLHVIRQKELYSKLYSWHFWIGDQSRFGKDIIDINTLK